MTVLDTSKTPVTYTIAPSATSINEGDTLTTTVKTTGVAAGTILYWSLSGTGLNPDDFSAGALTGSGTVKNDGTFSFSHSLRNDLTTEGNETLSINLFTAANRTPQQRVGNTASVTVLDTSRDPITGQPLKFNDIGTVANDTIYSGVNDITKGIRNVLLPGYTDTDLAALSYIGAEFEYNKNYIALTLVGNGDIKPYPSGYPAESPRSPLRGSGDWVARGIIQGSFAYASNGMIGPSNIQAVASSFVQISKNGRLGQMAKANSAAGVNITSLSRLADVEPLNNPSQLAGGPYFTQNLLAADGKRDNYANDPTAAQQIAAFGDGRFFYSGWETNPFNSNLL